MRRRRRSVDGEGAMRLAGGLALLGFLSSVSLLNAAQLPAAVPAAAAACTSDIQACRGLADGGDAEAQFGLGVVYGSGSGGVDEDDVEAARWYRRAADQGLAVAQFARRRCATGRRSGLPLVSSGPDAERPNQVA
jgi:hypothetical protein